MLRFLRSRWSVEMTELGEGLYSCLPCFVDEALEEGAGGGADVVAALRVPLHADEKLRGEGGVVLDGFDDAVVRAACDDAQALAGDGD